MERKVSFISRVILRQLPLEQLLVGYLFHFTPIECLVECLSNLSRHYDSLNSLYTVHKVKDPAINIQLRLVRDTYDAFFRND